MMFHGLRHSLDASAPCGDAFLCWREGPLWTICLVDGLGHGAEAALAAEAALTEAARWKALSPGDILSRVDDAIHGSRGAAMSVVRIDEARRTLEHAGVGNIRVALFGDKTLRLDGRAGIVGNGFKPGAWPSLGWRDGDVLVLWSDGLDPYLKLDRLSLRLKGNPEALAERLIDQFSTRRDDSCIVCCLLGEALG
ncbi:SpoIIE family protein phosphatase [Lichenifustis flavocetrariae]|uniref:Serine/threonine-protein phosphatase n=1 Tax=Lichenifustis flavocetrariae TaxID=2949735 RepID=A0AA42CMG6_9HYPH|nr:SpoIIE family protein phosphatase [Lichenifustis flavocetrariae]MCW6511566.1 serine/threonine-protein phosphatase [Lichenifustis flavocetrariae]